MQELCSFSSKCYFIFYVSNILSAPSRAAHCKYVDWKSVTHAAKLLRCVLFGQRAPDSQHGFVAKKIHCKCSSHYCTHLVTITMRQFPQQQTITNCFQLVVLAEPITEEAVR